MDVPLSRRMRLTFEKLIAKGLSVEEMRRSDAELESGEPEEMIQLKMAWESVGEVAYVTAGSHDQLDELEVQLLDVVSRKVVKV